MEERRESIRSNGLVLVNFKAQQANGKSSAYDISEAGVRITTEEELAIGESLEMEIYLPGDSQPIIAKGEVIWVEKRQIKQENQVEMDSNYYYAGIKFTTLGERNRIKIDGYVQRKIAQSKNKK